MEKNNTLKDKFMDNIKKMDSSKEETKEQTQTGPIFQKTQAQSCAYARFSAGGRQKSSGGAARKLAHIVIVDSNSI